MTGRAASLALAAALAVPPALLAATPRIQRPEAYLDDLLGRPYTQGTPFRGTGRCVWATHPEGFGFPNDVHYVQLDWLAAMELDLAWDGLPVEAGAGWAHATHLETLALPPGNLALNRSGTGLPEVRGAGGVLPSLGDGDRAPRGAVGEGPGASGEAVLELTMDASRSVGSVLVTLVADASRGLSLPDALLVEWRSPAGWLPVAPLDPSPPPPAAGARLVAFTPVTTDALRVRLPAAAPVGIAELEAYAPDRVPLLLVERKVVLEDDTLVSALEVRNAGERTATLSLRASSPLLAPAASGDALEGARVLHTIPVSMRLEVGGGALDGGALVRSLALAPGQSTRVVTAMSFARSPSQARAQVAGALGSPDPVGDRVAELRRRFLAEAPQLDVPDAMVEKLWAFRFDLLRRVTTDPRFGPLRHPTLQEGRWTAPWYARTITYGAPHQLREARWLRDALPAPGSSPREGLARGHALTFVANARPDGAFESVPLEGPRPEYTDWIAAAVAEVFLATGDTDLLARALPALRANVAYALTRDRDGDALPENADHYATGMEWQPSWFYWSGFSTLVPPPVMERADDASALFANAEAAALAAETLCEPIAASEMRAVAGRVRAAVEARMWDEAEGLYLSLRASDDDRALVREVSGFYPIAFGLSPPAHDRALAALADPTDFATPWPPASSSLRCPATAQDGWPVGPGGSPSMWNGPSWPHAISVLGDAMGRALRRGGPAPPLSRQQLFALLRSYTEAQFRSNRPVTDLSEPFVGEAIHGTLGVWKSGERDYLHATWIDLVVTLLVGLVPSREAAVRIDPLLPPGAWDRLLLDRLPYRGHDVTVVWDEPGGDDAYADGRDGLELWIDGELAASRPDLGPLQAPLAPPVLLATKSAVTRRPRLVSDTRSSWTPFRSASRDLDRAAPVAGGPFAAGAPAVDPGAPGAGVAYYRIGACGNGQ